MWRPCGPRNTFGIFHVSRKTSDTSILALLLFRSLALLNPPAHGFGALPGRKSIALDCDFPGLSAPSVSIPGPIWKFCDLSQSSACPFCQQLKIRLHRASRRPIFTEARVAFLAAPHGQVTSTPHCETPWKNIRSFEIEAGRCTFFALLDYSRVSRIGNRSLLPCTSGSLRSCLAATYLLLCMSRAVAGCREHHLLYSILMAACGLPYQEGWAMAHPRHSRRMVDRPPD